MNTQMNNAGFYESNISEVKEEVPAEIIDMNKRFNNHGFLKSQIKLDFL